MEERNANAITQKPFSTILYQLQRRQEELLLESLYHRGEGALPPDWTKKKEARLRKATNDFFYFARTYFPDYYFTADFNEWHYAMVKSASGSDRKLEIFAAPRGFGKTLIFRAFKIWCACFGKKHFYGKVSDTIDLVRDDYRLARLEFRYNPKLLKDFGEILDEKWDSMESFRIIPHKFNPKGTIFIAYSAEVTARGALAHTKPDFFEFDDFEDFATSASARISAQKLEIIERDFLPAMGENSSAVYLGNNSRTTCIINMLKTMPRIERENLHPAIRLNIIRAWDERKNQPTWHERYKYASEEEMRLDLGVSKAVWTAEYQQTPTPPEGARFLSKHWAEYDSLPADARGVIMCDPALGETHDYKAAAILLYSEKMRKFYAPDAFCRRTGWEEYFNAIYEMYARFKERIVYVGWESNFYQAQFLEFRALYISTRNMPPLPIQPVHVTGKKEWRIEKLETPFALGTILFAKGFLATHDGVEAQAQLIGYGAYPHDDYPDALATAYMLCWTLAQRSFGAAPQYISGDKRRNAQRF